MSYVSHLTDGQHDLPALFPAPFAVRCLHILALTPQLQTAYVFLSSITILTSNINTIFNIYNTPKFGFLRIGLYPQNSADALSMPACARCNLSSAWLWRQQPAEHVNEHTVQCSTPACMESCIIRMHSVLYVIYISLSPLSLPAPLSLCDKTPRNLKASVCFIQRVCRTVRHLTPPPFTPFQRSV